MSADAITTSPIRNKGDGASVLCSNILSDMQEAEEDTLPYTNLTAPQELRSIRTPL